MAGFFVFLLCIILTLQKTSADGCPPGYQTSPGCLQRCPDFRFGRWCANKCHCFNESEVCNKETGRCQSGCHRAYTGFSCQERTGIACFGPGCIFDCHCLDKSECFTHATPRCESGCEVGSTEFEYWRGPACQIGNMAYGKRVTQNMYELNRQNRFKSVAGYATDGVKSYDLAAKATQKSPTGRMPYLTIDLEDFVSIEEITVYSGNDKEGQLEHFEILFSDDLVQKFKCAENDERLTRGGSWNTTRCTVPTRYIIINCTGLNSEITNSQHASMTIAEVVVRGYKYTAACPIGFQPSPACLLPCDDGRFGQGCSRFCNCHDTEEACDKVTGECHISGCSRGFHGIDCSLEYDGDMLYDKPCTLPPQCEGDPACDENAITGVCERCGHFYEMATLQCQEGITNLALNKFATQSSTFTNNGTLSTNEMTHYGAMNAIDGYYNESNQFDVAATESGNLTDYAILQHWWMVDLSFKAVITKVVILLPQYDMFGSFYTYPFVYLSNTSDIENRSQAILFGYAKMSICEKDGVNYTSCAKAERTPLVGRYVIIRYTLYRPRQPRWLILSEVMVLGFKYQVCLPGYKVNANHCMDECDDGTFGSWCSLKCNCRNADEVCDKASGRCPLSGCKDGFHGFNCQLHDAACRPANVDQCMLPD